MDEQTPINIAFSPPFAAQIDCYFAELGFGVNPGALIRERRDILLWLNAKSDAELAEIGLARDDIPGHVFGDLFGPSRPS